MKIFIISTLSFSLGIGVMFISPHSKCNQLYSTLVIPNLIIDIAEIIDGREVAAISGLNRPGNSTTMYTIDGSHKITVSTIGGK